jgi:hypothetical protein
MDQKTEPSKVGGETPTHHNQSGVPDGYHVRTIRRGIHLGFVFEVEHASPIGMIAASAQPGPRAHQKSHP